MKRKGASSRRQPSANSAHARKRVTAGRIVLLVLLLLVAGWLLGGVFALQRAKWALESGALHGAGDWIAWTRRLRPWDREGDILYARYARYTGDLKLWNELRSAAPNAHPGWQLERELAAVEFGMLPSDPQQRVNELLARGAHADLVAAAFVRGFLAQRAIEEAQNVLATWLAAAPESAHAIYLHGVISQQLGERTAAKRLFREVLELQPAHEQARRDLAEMLLEEQNYDEALVEFRTLETVTEGSASTRLNVARSLRLLGRYDEALKTLQPESDFERLDLPYALERGHLALELGQYRDSVAWFERGEFEQSQNPATLEAAATALALAGERERAAQVFQLQSDRSSAAKRARDALIQ
jgi:tetratricopeptide (TPR) repeat protein